MILSISADGDETLTAPNLTIVNGFADPQNLSQSRNLLDSFPTEDHLYTLDTSDVS
jgi:hypothetical protein